MRLHIIVLAALLVFCARAFGGAEAKPTTELRVGRSEYEQRCAGCHGIAGKGDGISKAVLVHSPADLTRFARTHGGEFPYDHFYGTVDGRYAENDEMPSFEATYPEDPLDYRLIALATYVEDLQER